MRHKPKLAILTSRFPYPLEKGDKLRLYHQIKQLATAFEVFLLALSEEDIKETHFEQVAKYCSEVHTMVLPRSRRMRNVIKALLTGKPLQVGYYTDRRAAEHFKAILDRIVPDRLYCQLARMGDYASLYDGRKVIDYMDAFAVGMQRRAQVVPWWRKWVYNLEARRMRAYEQRLYRCFDGYTVISKQDQKALDLGPLSVISNGINTNYFSPRFDYKKSHDVAFIGNMGYLPNVAAAEFLVHEIAKQQKWSVLIAGARPDVRVQQLERPNVTVSGWVEDIREAYASARVFVAPLFNGTGQQNKILEAMAMGLPVITTPEVNEAIGAQDGVDIILARSPKQFVDAILTLLSDPEYAAQISAAARAMVLNNYSWQKQTEPLIDLLLEI